MLDFLTQAGATIFLLGGIWMMGNKLKRGPAISCLAEILFVIVGVQHHVWSNVAIGSVLFLVQARNFWKWNKEGAAW